MTAVQIAFSFDTTGSMSPCIRQVRTRIEEAFTPLFKEVPDLEVGVCAHGDYCDATYSYVTKWQPLTEKIYDVTKFVRDTGNTGGGDYPECYELVLHEARNLSWRTDAKKILVMIGDAIPHEPSYHLNRKNLYWRSEAKQLADMGVKIYTIQALSRGDARSWWQELATIGGGYHLTLDQFTDTIEVMKAIIYNEQGPEQLQAYEEKIVADKRMNRSLDATFGVLSGRPRDAKGRFISTRFKPTEEGLEPVPPGRFQILNVEANQDIKSFVTSNELEFKIGRGFYEFTKTEEIQEKKEVVLRDKVTGDMYSGAQAREMIGLPYGTRGKIKPSDLKYVVFVQSTSVNRKLIAGTRFLYEVDMDR